MTFAVLRSLHTIIGDALDDIERVYSSQGQSSTPEMTSGRPTPEQVPSTSSASIPGNESPKSGSGHKRVLSISQAYASPPPSPSIATSSNPFSVEPLLDFPCLDTPCDPTSLSESLTSHPAVVAAISRIVAAAGQLSATVQTPFLTLCDAVMGYHLPSCMRVLEASHVVEILKEAGPHGLHVQDISLKNGVDSKKLAHILRLLATHHILREVSPDVFTLNRISSLVDSGKTFADLKRYQEEGTAEMKYRDTNGTAAFVGLCTDEIEKASAYLTETYYLSSSKQTRAGNDPAKAPFCFAFDTVKTQTGFFGWLEGEVDPLKGQSSARHSEDDRVEIGRGAPLPPVLGPSKASSSERPPKSRTRGLSSAAAAKAVNEPKSTNWNRFRLERFGKAMTGTDGWEAPGAVLHAFDWHSLRRGSVVVDVGGGIGSTSMLLATAFSSSAGEDGLDLKFVIQDRPVVCDMGEKAWKAKCPELLVSTAKFQVHDFFTPQQVLNAAIFLLRVVLHDWPDDYARKILLQLRLAAMPDTKLLIADFVLPLACPDDMGSSGGLEEVDGAESVLASAPLLSNLGKASANVYWMDMTMQVMFNSKERTLREHVALALSAGWKVVKVTKTPGSLFGYLVAVPVGIPEQPKECEAIGTNSQSPSASETFETDFDDHKVNNVEREERRYRSDLEVTERASSRCGTPTFGSNMRLSSVQEALARFGGGINRSRHMSRTAPMPTSVVESRLPPPLPLKPALSLSSTTMASKKKPSPLSVPPLHGSSPPGSILHSPRSATGFGRRMPSASPRQELLNMNINSPPATAQSQSLQPSPAISSQKVIPRRMSLANLRPAASSPHPPPPLPQTTFTRQPPPSPLSPRYPNFGLVHSPKQHKPMARRASHANLSQAAAAAASAHVQSQVQHQPGSLLAPSFIPIRTSTSMGGTSTGGGMSVEQTPRSPAGSSRSGAANVAAPGSALGSTPTVVVRESSFSSGGGTSAPGSSKTMTRRSSYAQLTQVPTRQRSGTVVQAGPWLPPGSSSSYSVHARDDQRESTSRMSTRTTSGFSAASSSSYGGSVLRFDSGSGRRSSPSTRAHSPAQPSSDLNILASGAEDMAGSSSINVLAAAARIERGEFVQRSGSSSP